jgi:hypothetical protein
MALRLARTSAEAHLYMELHPCPNCGESEFHPVDSVIVVDDDLASRYAGPCPRCGRPREFTFRIPEEVLFPADDEPAFGDARPSELLDAGEWLWLADVIAQSVPAEPGEDMTADDRRQALIDLRTAAAAVAEAAKFVPPGADRVPSDALWSERGLALYTDEPGRFRIRRLDVVRETYRDLAERFA